MDNQITKSSPKDFFMYLLNTIALYISVTGILILLFQYISVAFPDPLDPYYDAGNPIRWALAMLIVVFPVLLFISRSLNKDLINNPIKIELRIRKWLLYFTLFVASVLIIGDLITLIYSFLQGELTMTFFLRILSVFAVTTAVFWYYLHDLRRQPGVMSKNVKIFIWAVIVVIIIAIIYGFFVAGSPFEQRLVRFDNQKVGDLQTIQNATINYWIQKQKLPQSLNDLVDNISGFAPPKDPQNGEVYVYKKVNDLSFELCAKFNLSSDNPLIDQRYYVAEPISPLGKQPENWKHDAGEICFKRIIDPELYKPNKAVPQ